jgi:putative salt-induced outer membrane protein YdiY
MNRHLKTSFFLAALMILTASCAVRADDAPAPIKKWKDSGEFSLVTTNGNSKGTTTSAKDTFNYNWNDVTGLELVAGGLGSSSGHTVTAENYNGSEKVTWKLVGKNYVFERFGWDKDRFAGIRNRYDSSAGLGRLLLDLPNDKLNGELGGGYINEQHTDQTHNDFGSGRAYAKYSHALSATSSFTQDGEYIHNFNNPKGYRFNTETALIAALSTHLSLKTSFDWKRNGQPPVGAVRDDTITSVALVVNY